ncbi:GNAT family N-acetyltransferase [Rhizorhabdus histidinilytica]
MSLGPTIETARLVLRPHRISDYEDCCALTSDPEAVRMIYQNPMSREDTWHRLLRFAGHWSLLGYGMLIVEEKQGGRVIGEVGLADFHRGLGDDFDPFPEMAWMMSTEVHGRGYATEAAQAVLRWMEVAFSPIARCASSIPPTDRRFAWRRSWAIIRSATPNIRASRSSSCGASPLRTDDLMGGGLGPSQKFARLSDRGRWVRRSDVGV